MENITIKDEVKMNEQQIELFRTLRTNIELSGVENKAIAITSCEASDGKSTCSLNLAMSMAEANRKVIFIDADLRKSAFLAKLENIKNELKGLSYYLSGLESLDNVICETNLKNLYVIPSGRFPVKPTELLENRRFYEMVKKLKEEYDYVIIDTPPLGLVIDAVAIVRQCDASILVVSSNAVSRKQVKRVANQLQLANPYILGVILNKVDPKTDGSYYNRKHYYKRYKEYKDYKNYVEAVNKAKKSN